ncbi:MAG: TolC family protein [Fuerstiella sp.]|nr:TolC family protein [Fuerstiella sp.]
MDAAPNSPAKVILKLIRRICFRCGLIPVVCLLTGCVSGLIPATEPSVSVDRYHDRGRSPVTDTVSDVEVGLDVDQVPIHQILTTVTTLSNPVIEAPSAAAFDGGPDPAAVVPVSNSIVCDSAEITAAATSPVVDTYRADPVTEPSGSWTLSTLQDLALQNNPAIQQASAAAGRADGIHNQTGLRPNPTLGYSAEEIGNGGSAGLHGLFVSQMFVRGEKLAWNRQVVGHEVQMLRWSKNIQRQRVLTDVRLHYITVLVAEQRLDLMHAFRQVARQGVRISRQRVAAKFAGRPDILQSEIQLSQVDLAIKQTELQREAAWQQLAVVVGLPNLARQTLQGNLELSSRTMDLDNTLAELLAHSPQFTAARHRVSRAQANLRRQQVQKIPNITARLGTGHDAETDSAYANVQLSIPIPVHNRNQGNVHAAWAEYCEATQNIRRLKMQIRRDLTVQMLDYQSAKSAVEQYRDVILPKAKETLNLMKQAQAGGEYNFLRVLTARRALYDASIEYVDARSKAAVADATIDGLLLVNGLNHPVSTSLSTGLRGQALSQQ